MKRDGSTYQRALNLLSFRARSVAELRRALLRKGESAAGVEDAIVRLLELKLLDDRSFARQFARVKVLGSGASRLRISQLLTRKGVPRDVADAAIEELRDAEGVDPSDSIHRVAARKWKSLAKLDDITRRRRVFAFLARRGFNPDEIRAALNALGDSFDS